MLEILSSIPFLDSVQILAAKTYSSFCNDTKVIWGFLGNIIMILKIAIPVIIILLGTIDLGKAVMAGEDKKIKEAQKMLLMRLIYGVAIFFVTTIVQVVFGLVAGAEGTADDSSICWSCVSNKGCK